MTVNQKDPITTDETDAEKKLAEELAKILFSNTLDYIKSLAQTLQTVTGLFLTGSITLALGFGKPQDPNGNFNWLYLIPTVLFVLSLITSFAKAYFYKGPIFVPGNYLYISQTYQEVVKNRQKQLRLPAIFTLLGILLLLGIIVVKSV